MNRLTVDQGTKDASGKVVITQTQGKQIAYDLAGRRISETRWGTTLTATPTTSNTPALDASGNPIIDAYGNPVTEAVTTTAYGTATGTTVESYRYDGAGNLVGIRRDGIEVESRSYDTQGRLVQDKMLLSAGNLLQTLGYQSTSTVYAYEAGSNRLHAQTTTGAGGGYRTLSDGSTLVADRFYQYDDAGNLIHSKGDTFYSGYGYELSENQITTQTIGDRVVQTRNFSWSAAGTDRYRDASVTQAYDANGELASLTPSSPSAATPTRRYITDAAGHVLQIESFDAGGNRLSREHHLVVLGEEVMRTADTTLEATWTNDGQVSLIVNAGTARTGNNLANAPRIYVVQAGDTFAAIAKAVWGDASLGSRIADANGVAEPLVAGEILTLPAAESVGAGSTWSSQTLRPYDPTSVIGDTSPMLPAPPVDGGGGCGGMGQIIQIAIMVVVAVYAPTLIPALQGGGVLAAAGAAALGDVAGQVAGNVMGTQDGFSLKEVAASALSAGIAEGVTSGLGLDKATTGLKNATANQMAQAAIRSTVSQGVNVALGLQDHFSWRQVAASAIAAPLAQSLGEGVAKGIGGTLGKIAGRMAYGMTSQVVTHAVAGGRITPQSVFTDTFGNVLGESLAAQMVSGANGQQTQGLEAAKQAGAETSQVADARHDAPLTAAQGQAMTRGYGPLTPNAAEAVQANGYEQRPNDLGVRNPTAQVPINDPSVQEVQNADGSRLLLNGGNQHPITAFTGNQILAGRESPVNYSTATIDEEHKTINIEVKMDYQTPSLASRMAGLASSVTDEQFAKYADLANAGLAQYWSRTVTLNGSDYAVTVSGQQSSDGMPITLANPGSPLLGDLSSRSRNPYPTLTGNLYYDSKYGGDANAMFSMTAAHEIGHGFLTNAFGKDWSWGHEGTSTTMGNMFTNAPQYPATGEIGLMSYYKQNQTTPVYRADIIQRTIASENDVKTLIYISGRSK